MRIFFLSLCLLSCSQTEDEFFLLDHNEAQLKGILFKECRCDVDTNFIKIRDCWFQKRSNMNHAPYKVVFTLYEQASKYNYLNYGNNWNISLKSIDSKGEKLRGALKVYGTKLNGIDTLLPFYEIDSKSESISSPLIIYINNTHDNSVRVMKIS